METRARALEQALRGILEIGKRDMSNPKYDGYFEAAREALAVNPPPSGASPQAEASRCAETCGLLRCRLNEGHSGLHQVYNAATGDFQQFIGHPAPVSPVEPTTCPKCRSNTRAYRLAVADVIDGRMAGMTSCRDEWHSRLPMVSPVEPEPPTKARCPNCGSSDVGEDGHETNGPAGWQGTGDSVCAVCEHVWKPTVEPEPCVWREVGLFLVRPLLHPGEHDHDKNRVKRYKCCPYCGAPLKVER